MTQSWLNPAGGLRYHARAARYSRVLWDPFRWALGEWLLDFQPPERTLLLVGPSAGYNLQPFFFERFERVVCLEPDPIARYLFRRRLERAPLDRRPELSFVAEDHLVHHPERLSPLLQSLGECALLFSNVIGQLRVLIGDGDRAQGQLARTKAAIHEALQGRSFASFHDRVSGTVAPAFEPPLQVSERLSDEQLLSELYDRATLSGVAKQAAPDEPVALLDHFTDGIFPNELPHTYFIWELEPGVYHLIEATRSVHEPAATG